MSFNIIDFLILVGAFVLIVFSHVLLKARHPLLSTFKNALAGIFMLIAINVISPLTSISIPVSLLSIGISSVVGIPGVTLLLALKFI